MRDYCFGCGEYLTVSQVTLRCAECEDEWVRDYQAREGSLR